MSSKVVNLTCPGCGAAVTTSQKDCIYCGNPIVITTFNSVFSMTMPEINKYTNTYKKALADNPENSDLNSSIAMCYLKLKLFSKSVESFEKVMEDDISNSEIYFYTALALLEGKKPFVAQRATIDKIEEYINAAIMIEPKGIYCYFGALIKYDYFNRKFLNTTPNYQEMLAKANEFGVSTFDIDNLFATLNISKPDCF